MPHRYKESDPLEPDIRRAIQAWSSGQEDAVMSKHPEVEALVAYQEGNLDELACATIREHLVLCDDCRQELLALESFDQPIPEGSDLLPSAQETAASWLRFEAARDALPTPPLEQPLVARWRGLWLLAAAVLLAFAAGFFASRWLPLESDPGVLLANGSPVTFVLDPLHAVVQRDVMPTKEVTVAPNTPALVATLNLGDLTPHDRYAIEVRDPTDTLVLVRTGLSRDSQGRIVFGTTPAQWPPGDYQIALIGIRGDEESALASYAVRLRAAP